MRTLQDMLTVAWKEVRLIAADKGALAVLFLLPLLFGTMYGTINQQAAQENESPTILVEVVLVNEDEGPFGDRVAQALDEIAILRVTRAPAAEAEERVARGDAVAVIVFPPDLSERIAAYETSAIEIVADPAQPEAASIVTGIMNRAVDEVVLWGEVQYGVGAVLGASGLLDEADEATQRAVEAQSLGVIMTQINAMRREPAVSVVSVDMQGARVTGGIELFFAHLFPAFTVMFAFFTVGMAGASLLREREMGTLRRLLAAPVAPSAVIGGKVLGYMGLVCMQVVVLFTVARTLFGMPLGESPLGLVVLTLVLAAVATALGMMIASLSRSPKQADSIGTVLGFVLGGLGGTIAFGAEPMARGGGPMSVVARLTPHAHALEAYYSLMAERAALGDVLPQIGALVAMGLLFGAVAAWRFRYLD